MTTARNAMRDSSLNESGFQFWMRAGVQGGEGENSAEDEEGREVGGRGWDEGGAAREEEEEYSGHIPRTHATMCARAQVHL
jgi:hypothetical protein